MVALALILLSAVVHAVVNLLTKRADDPYAMRLLIGTFSAVLVAPFLFLVPLPHGLAVWLLFATAAVHAVYELLLVKSYESAAFSAVYPVARGTGPLFTAIGAILILHERAPLSEIAGIAMVCGGVIAMGLSHRATDGALRGLAFALGTGLTIGILCAVVLRGAWRLRARHRAGDTRPPHHRRSAQAMEARRTRRSALDHDLRLGHARLSLRRDGAACGVTRNQRAVRHRARHALPRRQNDLAPLVRGRSDRGGSGVAAGGVGGSDIEEWLKSAIFADAQCRILRLH
jgi:multidrug transporter EmrE-like cation transporter